MVKNLALAVSGIINALLLVLVVVLYQMSSFKPARSPTLDHTGLLAVEVNHGCEEVIQRIGFPVEIAPGGARVVERTNHSGKWPVRYRWIYSRAGWPEGLSVVVGISDCKVTYVSAKDGDRLLYLETERGVEVEPDDRLKEALHALSSE